MRTKLVVGNWKMNKTQPEARATVEAFIKFVDSKSSVDVAVCPSFLAMRAVGELLRNTHIKLGAQDVFWAEHGAFTGFVSASMLADAGASYCIVGHSEKRGRFGKLEVPPSTLPYFGESNETINLKLRSLLLYSINPILCVGESAAERDANQTDETIRAQLIGALDGLEAAELYSTSIAYEPVWAIGTGKSCDAAEANRVCALIRNTLAEVLDADVAAEMRVLYGGSVKSSNSRELFGQENIDGALVGGASLDPQEFSLIVMSA